MSSQNSFLNDLQGQKVVFICARYSYWGILSEVNGECRNPYAVLANAVAVEQSGASDREAPEVIDPIGCSIQIYLDAVEIVMQPRWSKAPLPGEDVSNA